MEILLGKTAGFCMGIKNAIKMTDENLKKYNKLECLGDLLHNNQVLEKLKARGLKVIDSIDEAKEKVIIRAHGVTKEIYEMSEKRNIELIDCTCPKVLKVHELAEKLSKKNSYIVVIGEKKHPETIGTYSFVQNGEIIQDIEELKLRMDELNKKEIVEVITQTTCNIKKFKEIENYLKENIKTKLKVHNRICNATELRQKETDKISKQVDFMIIIGGPKSSNTNKLYEISKQNCKNAIKIETVKELYNINFNNINKVGVMAGASTPDESIEDVINYLKERK